MTCCFLDDLLARTVAGDCAAVSDKIVEKQEPFQDDLNSILNHVSLLKGSPGS